MKGFDDVYYCKLSFTELLRILGIFISIILLLIGAFYTKKIQRMN
ncbi:hypothetical protein [Leptospira interrogans]|nr:hypothetical protein [Leptospira interrogans]